MAALVAALVCLAVWSPEPCTRCARVEVATEYTPPSTTPGYTSTLLLSASATVAVAGGQVAGEEMEEVQVGMEQAVRRSSQMSRSCCRARVASPSHSSSTQGHWAAVGVVVELERWRRSRMVARRRW